MKSLEYIKENYKSGSLDGRDLNRLAQFIPFEMFPFCGMELKEGVTKEDFGEVKAFTKENILTQLQEDVEFAFEKALNRRGISAGLMYDVVSMWNWILEEGLEDFDEYTYYGLPLFKATAIKYGWSNPIGNDSGSESKYED